MAERTWSEVVRHALPEFFGVAAGTVAIAVAIALWGLISKNPPLLYGSIGAMAGLVIASLGSLLFRRPRQETPVSRTTTFSIDTTAITPFSVTTSDLTPRWPQPH